MFSRKTFAFQLYKHISIVFSELGGGGQCVH